MFIKPINNRDSDLHPTKKTSVQLLEYQGVGLTNWNSMEINIVDSNKIHDDSIFFFTRDTLRLCDIPRGTKVSTIIYFLYEES